MLLKIFLTFWLTLALLAAGQELVSVIAHNDEQRGIGEVRPLLDDARGVVEAYEAGGVAAARVAADAYKTRHGLSVDLLGADRRSLLGQPLRPAVVDAAAGARRLAESGIRRAAFNLSEGVAAQEVATARGERLTMIVGLPRRSVPTVARRLTLSDPFRLASVLLVGGVLCFALARHLSRPLLRVARAANALADGRLQTRVGGGVAARHDEVGHLARDFDRMAERIETLVAGQRRMLGDVSHELRSPLARLTVAAGLARRDAPASAGEYFDRIETETVRLDRLIEQLLTLARIESGVDDHLRGPVNLTELVQAVVSDGDFEARAAGRSVSLDAADEIVLHGRSDLLRSAVENVVRNAIRYTPAGSAVEVRLQRDGHGSAARARLSVRDRGPGVPEAAVRDMFRRFWRDGEADAQSEGAGLGLAIADSVVRLHGGSIEAINDRGGGLLVTIDLPIA